MGKSRVRNPTLEEKKMISAVGLVAKNWYVIRNTPEQLELVSKGTGRSRKIKKAT